MSTENINNNGIKWGPFRLRIPFIHIKLLPSEFIQGLIISGATALAGAPIVEALGLEFMQAVAVCFIASFLIGFTGVKHLIRFLSLKLIFSNVSNFSLYLLILG